MKKIENLIDIDFARSEIVPRPRDMHKGDAGKVLVIAGSKGMAGAACLCAKAALRTGSGLVQTAVTDEILNTVQCVVPEATCVERSVAFDSYDAIAFGPGLGVSEEGKDLLLKVLNEYEGPLVIDADGLNIIARYALTEEVRNTKAKVVITPHVGEAKRLLGRLDTPMGEETREEMVLSLAEKFNCTAVLKGNMSLVASGKKVMINATGNPGMATGGSGDVLTGIIASLLGQGIDVVSAAGIGTFLHGMAGDIMAAKLGEYGLISSDLLEGIALAMKMVSEGC